MKLLRNTLVSFLIFFGLTVVSLYAFNYGYIITAVKTVYFNGHTTAFLKDYQEFDNRIIQGSNTSNTWPEHELFNQIQQTEKLKKINIELGTTAFLIIKNDSIWHESYYDSFDENEISNSFSMAKTIVSALLGKAISEGYIKGLDQPVTDFFPQFESPFQNHLTIGDLSTMSSGLDWDESYYSPFSVSTRSYFSKDLRELILSLKIKEEPGKHYKYQSCNTELLGMILEKATGKPLSEYLSSSFWIPLGITTNALWQLDSDNSGMEKAYCCIAATARDFSRFGRLYKDYGKWNGVPLLDSAFVARSKQPRFKESPQYGYGLWLLHYKEKDFFMMRGHLGQYVIVQPEDDLIITRLGHRSAPRDPKSNFRSDILTYIDESYQMLNNDQQSIP
ncbi:serine hydrolase domain-containing protein [Robertkochia solimangrovi]|uniref:serine hydrolase domain-containing protein n=1 Tax=Robertkochia solimangrovi TaxID=2213046 RepID=UPI00117F3F51|nr:serine hydrolase [Robertkochia solimangrovi]TRZ45961.1 serine hydrolase [Robertkochia solimangrovi]